MIDIQYVNDNIVIRSRDKNKKRTIVTKRNFFPYLYFPEDNNFWGNSRAQVEEDKLYKTLFGSHAKKLICKNDWTRKLMSRKFKESYEADVRPELQYLLDNYNELPEVPHLELILDIEVDSIITFPTAELAQYPVTCVACHNSFTDKVDCFAWRDDLKVHKTVKGKITKHYYNTEQSMINALLKYLVKIDFDILTGWNVDKYDMQYLINRCKKLEIDISIMSPYGEVEFEVNEKKPDYSRTNILGRHVIDAMVEHERLIRAVDKGASTTDRRALDAVAEKYLGEHKYKFEGTLGDLWRNDIETLIDYNIKDVILVRRILDKFGYMGILDRLRRLCRATWNMVDRNSLLLDLYMLRYAHEKKDIVLPSKIYGREHEKYEGAKVYQPPEGTFDYVAVLDLASMYLNIIVQFNLSMEKMNDYGPIQIKDLHFDEEMGFSSEVVATLITEKSRCKKLANEAKTKDEENFHTIDSGCYKVLLLSAYGALGYPNFRLYEPQIAALITYMGRTLLDWSKSQVEKLGYTVLYGDTDSLFVDLDTNDTLDALVRGKQLQSAINDSYDEFVGLFGIKKNTRLEIEFETLFSPLILVGTKKRYMGRIVWKSGKVTLELGATGFETRRTDTPSWAHATLSKFYDMALDREDNEVIQRFLLSKLDDVDNATADEIGISMRFGKNIEDYVKNTPMHVRGAKYMIDNFNQQFARLDYGKILFVSEVPDGCPETDVITLKEGATLPEGFKIDKQRTFERLIEKKVDDLLRVIGVDVDKMFGREKKKKRKKKHKPLKITERTDVANINVTAHGD
jgi:DNA polymerase elongation subunit (family B)